MLRLLVLIPIAFFAVAAQAAEYAEGQVWKYLTRPGEEQSLLTILRIDIDPQIGPIYHLQLDGLAFRNPGLPGGTQSLLPHVPVDRNTLDSSVTELLPTPSGMPDLPEGYWIWREAFDNGSAGVFNIPVRQVVQFVEDAFNNQSKLK